MSSQRSFSVSTRSAEESVALGRALAKWAPAGLVIDLRGELGAGKTQFVRGLAAGLQCSSTVRSPTFTIAHRYDGRIPLFHLDVYRIEDPEEVLLQGWDEMCNEGVVAVEWGSKIEEIMDPDRLVVEIEHQGETLRLFRFETGGTLSSEIVEKLSNEEGRRS